MQKKMQLSPAQYRLHRFPPLAKPLASQDADDFSFEHEIQVSQQDIQKSLEEGFQQGLNQGHEEGFRQGKEQGFQQGMLDGQKEGFQKGFISGEQAGREQFIDVAKPVHELFQALSHWKKTREQEQRKMICTLVQKVSQQVIRAELTLMPQQILTLVNETLDSLPSKSESVTVQLNPQDLERISQINADIPTAWKLVPNKDLPVGGCHLITEDAEADASSDSRLEACMNNVKQHLLDEISIIHENNDTEDSTFNLDGNAKKDGDSSKQINEVEHV